MKHYTLFYVFLFLLDSSNNTNTIGLIKPYQQYHYAMDTTKTKIK